MNVEYTPVIEGDVSMPIQTYETWKKYTDSLKKENERLEKNIQTAREATKELATFFNHLAGSIDNFADVVAGFNSVSESSEILATDSGDYKIKFKL